MFFFHISGYSVFAAGSFQNSLSDSIPEQAIVLSRYIQQRSYSGNEYDAGMYLLNVCREKNLYTRIFTDTGGSINFAASLYPLELKKPNIVFFHHLDVVPEGDVSKWKYPPFSGIITEGSVWGRGALDIKGLGIMHLFALASFSEIAKERELPYNFTLLAVSGEETGGHLGSKIIANSFFDELNAVLFLGEGGSGISDILPATKERPVFGISIAEKVTLWLRLSLDLETLAHGSITPDEYPNQIMIEALSRINNRIPQIKFNKASRRMFKEIGKIEGGLKGFILQNINWIIFKPFVTQFSLSDPNLYAVSANTITITSINNPSGAHNQIAQSIEATLDCRLLATGEEHELIQEIRTLLKDPCIKIEIIDKEVNSFVTIPEDFFLKFETAIKSIYKKSRVVPIFFPASSDNNYFRNKGVPVYGINPIIKNKALLNTIHNFNEHLPIDKLMEGQMVFEQFIKILIDSTNIEGDSVSF